MLSILYVVFILSVIIQVAYYYIFSEFSFLKIKNLEKHQPTISVIICARNEVDNLSVYLEKIVLQQYPCFEVIVVNDASTDTTSTLLKKLETNYEHLKVIDINATNEYSGNKKNAITNGINAAKYEHLLFTDADCEPATEQWISEMASQFSDDKRIILGYGAYRKIHNSFLNKLIRFETLITAVQYFSYSKIGVPYMGVGRNLAYQKTIFKLANGLESHAEIKSGDDDLFINDVATKQNTAICFSKKSFTVSEPHTSFKGWFKQKRRHLTTANHYKPIHQFLLGFYYISQILFWLLAIILLALSLIGQMEIWSVLILIGIRLLIQYIIVGNAAKKLDEKDLLGWIPLLDMFLVFIQFSLFCTNLIAKPKSW